MYTIKGRDRVRNVIVNILKRGIILLIKILTNILLEITIYKRWIMFFFLILGRSNEKEFI